MVAMVPSHIVLIQLVQLLGSFVNCISTAGRYPLISAISANHCAEMEKPAASSGCGERGGEVGSNSWLSK